ncbi:hypothetical protein [Shinella granuli]|uniref:hypothetical protein n=1 Tax=Shinella granuli TaxID=323621 RepID=UPI0031E506E3
MREAWSRRSCSSLFDKRPDLFPNAKNRQKKASETTLSVDEDTLMDFFNTVLSVFPLMSVKR